MNDLVMLVALRTDPAAQLLLGALCAERYRVIQVPSMLMARRMLRRPVSETLRAVVVDMRLYGAHAFQAFVEKHVRLVEPPLRVMALPGTALSREQLRSFAMRAQPPARHLIAGSSATVHRQPSEPDGCEDQAALRCGQRGDSSMVEHAALDRRRLEFGRWLFLRGAITDDMPA